ncbi:MAG: ABC transporter substrate-binding protein [Oscillospiraceae bacterium]|nr:ABC transporter substrate-binding protein [Oscillospiraceae bacterium]
MTKKRFIALTALLMAAVMLFAACARQSVGKLGFEVPDGHPLQQLEYLLEQFPQSLDTGEAHVPGTTFMYGIGSTSPISGIIGGSIFTDQALDQYICDLLGTGSSSLTSMTDGFQHGQDGVATFDYDLDAKTITLTMQHDVYWHDGVPLTLEDLVFTYELLAHPDYSGLRRTAEIELITGFLDYAEGRADHISGLVLSEDKKTLTKHLDEMPVTLLYFALWYSPMPKHIFENIPMIDMASSDAVLVNPIGWGPFKIDHIVPGDAFEMVRNENYVFGAPPIERLRVERFDPTQAGELMASGRFDFIRFPSDQYIYHADASNFTFLGQPSDWAGHIAFRLGNWDFDNNKNVYNPDRLMAQVGPQFRQAMAYAIDEAAIGQALYNGLQFPAASIISPNHLPLVDVEMPGFTYDPDKARQLLDDAGFNQFDAEGFRLMPDGSPLVIYWALASGPLEEEIHAFYTQAWRDIGLRVELWQERTHDQLYLWDVMDVDLYYNNPDYPTEVHIYSAAWSMGANPNPEGVWGHIFWNTCRYTSPEYDDILARMVSPEAWDPEYMDQVFSDWQWYFYNNVPVIPTRWRLDLHAINNRVTNWDTRNGFAFNGSLHGWQNISLSAAEPYRG